MSIVLPNLCTRVPEESYAMGLSFGIETGIASGFRDLTKDLIPQQWAAMSNFPVSSGTVENFRIH